VSKDRLSAEDRLRQNVTRLKNNIERYKTTIKGLEATVKTQKKEIEVLNIKLEDKEAQRKQLLTYLYKPGKKEGEGKPRGKKPGNTGHHRPIPSDDSITILQTFSITQCPICHKPVGDPVDTVVKYEEDIDLAPHNIVTKFIITRHWCSHCETFVRAKDIPPISRIGVNVLGYILYARYRLNITVRKTKESLADLHNFNISIGEIAEKLKEAESLFGKDYEAIVELVKTASVVYADETGWRMEGENWYLWVFVTDKGVRYVVEDTRGGGVAQRALGEKNDRVIVSDGYSIYGSLPGENQQCWVHLLRVAKFASYSLYADLVKLYELLGTELTKETALRDPPRFERLLTDIVEKAYKERQAEKVQRRIKKHKTQLLVCLKHTGVLPENNTAERAIRPQVIMRKIFGGSRSIAGAKAHEVNTSVLETLRRQNPDKPFFDVVLPLLQSRRSES
jgi:transposase